MHTELSIGMRGPTCIIADRHQTIRESLKLLLEDEGFNVVGTAATGESALELIRSTRPDVAVLDLRLPDMTAIELASKVGTAPAIVILAGQASAPLVREALATGVRAIALKHVPPLALLEALAHATAGKTYVDPAIPG